VTKKELHDAFAEGRSIESIEPSRHEVRPDLKDVTFRARNADSLVPTSSPKKRAAT
jgi:hypothetical protein